MPDLLSQLGLAANRQEAAAPGVDASVYGPYAPAIQGLERAVQTYVNQRQESVMLDAWADALGNELRRYAEKGRVPDTYLERFANFNSLPLNQKRALVSQGALLLQQNQARDEVEAEQGRQNLQLLGNLATRVMNAWNMWVDNKRQAAQAEWQRERERTDRRQARALLEGLGIKLPGLGQEEGVSPELARSLIAHNRQSVEVQGAYFQSEDAARKAAEELRKQLRGTNRVPVVLPHGEGKWKVGMVAKQADQAVNPRAFDANKNNVLDSEEFIKFREALAMSQIYGGVYPGMRLDQANPPTEMDDEQVQNLLDAIDLERLK